MKLKCELNKRHLLLAADDLVCPALTEVLPHAVFPPHDPILTNNRPWLVLPHVTPRTL